MTPMQRKILTTLAAEETGTLSFVRLREAAGCTMRGFRTVKERMLIAGLVEMAPYCGTPRITITQEGRIALGALGEPCSICGGQIAIGDGADRRGDVTHDVCLEDAGEVFARARAA
jgi:hypothetical protein